MTPLAPPSTLARTLRALAHLLRYPDAELRAHLDELAAALHAERALAAAQRAALDALVAELAGARGLAAEAVYVELFDRGRGTSLNLFEQVHGESRERGPAMISLIRTYEQAGLELQPGELPDHLPVLLEYASTQPARQARAFLGEFAHLLRALHTALARRASAYAAVPAALLALAGEAAGEVALPEEPPLDEAWAEPAAFDGCASAGQGAARPIHIVKPRRPQATQGARP